MNTTSFKRKFLQFIGPLTWFLIGFIIGIVAIVLYYCLSDINIKKQESYDPWILAHYLFAILGSIGTILAVIVALGKEAILKWLYRPRLKVTPVDNGIMEILNENTRVPEALSYECHVSIENIGSLVAMGCKVFISDIKYSKTSKKDCKTIKTAKNKQLYWISNEVDLPIGIANKIKLFEIVNPGSVGTPQSDNSHPPIIKFNGCNLPTKQTQKGCWIIDYYVCCKNGDAMKFNLIIEWSGEFKSRATDMNEILKIQIETK